MKNDLKLTSDSSEEELYQAALKQPLEYKIQVAINLLRQFAPADGSPYYLAYSGGKDSGVIMELAIMAGVPFMPHYNATSLDPPELIRFIKKHHPEVKWNRRPETMLTYMIEKCKGLPTRHGRWCCAIYKEQGGDGMVKIIGVRAAESPRRKKLWKQMVPNKKTGKPIICPIIYWTDKDVWDFHKLRNLPYCSLYDEGLKRLGCVGCPMGNQKKDFARWPRFEKMFRRASDIFIKRWKDVPNRFGKPRYFAHHKDGDSYFDWWISGKRGRKDKAPMCQLEFLFSDPTTEDDEDDKQGKEDKGKTP